MAGKDYNKRITKTSKGDDREFKGSGVEGKKGAVPSNKTNKEKEELKNVGT